MLSGRRYDVSNLRVHAASLMAAAREADEAIDLLDREQPEVRRLLVAMASLLAVTAGTLDYYADRQDRADVGPRR